MHGITGFYVILIIWSLTMKYILTNTLSSSARSQGHPRAGRSTIVPWAYEASPMFNRDFSCHAIELRR